MDKGGRGVPRPHMGHVTLISTLLIIIIIITICRTLGVKFTEKTRQCGVKYL